MVTGFSPEKFDKGDQVGLAGVERLRENWKVLMKGSHWYECCDQKIYAVPRYKATLEKILETGISKQESIEIVPMERRLLQTILMVENRKEE